MKKKEKIILSENFSLKLIKEVHECYGHIGINQLQNKISHYTAKNLTNNIKKFCKCCEICIKNKARGQMKVGLMSHLGPAKKPFEIVSIDTIGGFGGSRSTKKYLHLLADHFTRHAYILTSKTQSANDFIKLVKDNVPETNKIGLILTDQYPGINSKEFKKYLCDQDIQLIFTTVNAPFSNGLNERLNQTLVNKIRCKMNEKEKNKFAWTTIAHMCTKQYNDNEHTVTKFAPSYLMNGTDVAVLPRELKQDNSEQNWIQDRKIALKNTIKSHDYNKQIYDRNRKDFKKTETN